MHILRHPQAVRQGRRLPTDADRLLRLLRFGPKAWKQLAEVGLDRRTVLLAVGHIVDCGDDRVRVGPLLLGLEPHTEGDA